MHTGSVSQTTVPTSLPIPRTVNRIICLRRHFPNQLRNYFPILCVCAQRQVILVAYKEEDDRVESGRLFKEFGVLRVIFEEKVCIVMRRFLRAYKLVQAKCSEHSKRRIFTPLL